jgi:hypothetical protein
MVSDEGKSRFMIQLEEFKESPPSVKNGLTVQILAWIWHFISYYYFFGIRPIPQNQIAIGIAVCVFVFSLKNWGRVLCILCNIMVGIEYLIGGIGLYERNQIYLGLIALMNVSLFSLASYFLLQKSTRDFYKSKLPPKEDENSEKTGENK